MPAKILQKTPHQKTRFDLRGKTTDNPNMNAKRLHEIIFEADTRAGKAFDIALLWAIVLSVLAVMLESVDAIYQDYGTLIRVTEWILTILFTIEYILRLCCVRQPLRYAFSFFGIVDFLAILPTYLSLFIPGTQHLMVIRILRLLRVFRILKAAQFVREARQLTKALKASRRKITVFLGFILSVTAIIGTIMYLVEGPDHGFTSVPTSVYWAIVTLTTVGYGDLAPETPIGQIFASMVMILGYSVLAVPTGIISVELAQVQAQNSTQSCQSCSAEGHDVDAVFCKRCGHKL